MKPRLLLVATLFCSLLIQKVSAQESWGLKPYLTFNSILYNGASLIESEDGVSLFYKNIAHEVSYFGEVEKTKNIENLQFGNNPLTFFADKIGGEFIVFHLNSSASNDQNILASHLDKDFLLQGDIFEIPENISGIQGRKGLSAVKKSNGNYLVFGEAFISEVEFSPQQGFSVVSQIPASYDVESIADLNGKFYGKQGTTLFELNQDLSISWEKDLSATYTSISQINNVGGSLFIQGQSNSGDYQCTKYNSSGTEIFTFSKQSFLGSHIIDDGQSYLVAEEGTSAKTILRLNLQGEEVENFDFHVSNIHGFWKNSKGGYFLLSHSGFFYIKDWGDKPSITTQQQNSLRSNDMYLPLSSSGYVNYFLSPEQGPLSIFATNLWAGGVDENGFTAVHGPDFNPTSHLPGPSTISSAIFDRVWKVTQEQIQLVRSDIADGTKDEAWPYAIRSWPAKGNPHFLHEGQLVDIQEELAPFVDVDGDGIYNAYNGDYPVIKGDEMLYSIQHTDLVGATIPMNFEIIAYRFKNAQDPSIQRTIFLESKIKNNGLTDFDAFHTGFWVDADLGCYFDDYLGCLPSKNAVYVYNQDEVDGINGADCNGAPTFGNEPPLQSISLVEDSLYSFISYNNPTVGNPILVTTDPNHPIEYLNYLQGKWRDGTPITIGGDGYDPTSTDVTRYQYSGNPANMNDWTACSGNDTYKDKRILFTKFPEPFAVGEKISLKLAFTMHDSPNLPCPDIDEIADELDAVKNNHSMLTDVENPNQELDKTADIQVYPNPTESAFSLAFEKAQISEVRIFDLHGKMILQQKTDGFAPISVENLTNGCYFMQIQTSSEIAFKKVMVLR